MQQNKQKNLGTSLVFIITFMIYCAVCDSLKGVFIPIFKNEFNVKNTSMGLLLTCSSLGYILGTYISGNLCDRYGQKKLMIFGNLIIITSMPFMILGSSYYSILIGLFIMNAGIAFVGIGINTLVPLIMVSFQSVLMNFIHFSYGLGSMLTQMNAGILIFNGIEWRTMYLVLTIFLVIITFLFIPSKMPPTKPKFELSENFEKKSIFKNPITYLYIVCLGFYAAGEMGTGSWLINYLQEGFGVNEKVSAFYSGLFYGGLMLGRLLGGYITEKIGYYKTVSISLGIIILLYPIGIYLDVKGAIIISLCGLFCSIVFPTLVLTIGDHFKEGSAYATGIIITAVSTIVLCCNMLVGYLNDKIGVEKGFSVIVIFFLISFIFSLKLAKGVEKNNVRR